MRELNSSSVLSVLENVLIKVSFSNKVESWMHNTPLELVLVKGLGQKWMTTLLQVGQKTVINFFYNNTIANGVLDGPRNKVESWMHSSTPLELILVIGLGQKWMATLLQVDQKIVTNYFFLG